MKLIREKMDEQSKNFHSMLKALPDFKFLFEPEPFENFDELGLRYPHEHLDKIGRMVCFCTVERMVTYCDATTKQIVDNLEYQQSKEMFIYMDLEKSLQDFDFKNEDSYNKINATSIGNIAYVMEYHKDESLKKICESFLLKITSIELKKLFSLSSIDLQDKFGIDLTNIKNIVEDELGKAFEQKDERENLILKIISCLDVLTLKEIKSIKMIIEEFSRAKQKHPNWPTDIIHQSAIISEECGELIKDTIDYIYHCEDSEERKNLIEENTIKEAVQIGAMSIRFTSNRNLK